LLASVVIEVLVVVIFFYHNATTTPTYLQVQLFFSSKNLVVGGHLVILGCDVAFSSHGHIPSSPPLFS
jgi:hypothetical protein